MTIVELLRLFRFIIKSKSCLVLREDLVLDAFGKNDLILEDYEKVIMEHRYEHHHRKD